MTVVPVFQIHCVRDYIKECDIINIPWIASVCVFFSGYWAIYKKSWPPLRFRAGQSDIDGSITVWHVRFGEEFTEQMIYLELREVRYLVDVCERALITIL